MHSFLVPFCLYLLGVANHYRGFKQWLYVHALPHMEDQDDTTPIYMDNVINVHQLSYAKSFEHCDVVIMREILLVMDQRDKIY